MIERIIGIGDRMLNSKAPALALAICIASALPGAASACSVDQLKGTWTCEGPLGGGCMRGFDVSHVMQPADGSWRWTDGMGHIGTVSVKDQDVTVHYTTGPKANTDVMGKIDDSCHEITWSPTQHDRKS
jgi:hypothetical protein